MARELSDEKKAEHNEKVLAEGRFAVDSEEDDNAVDVSNEAYIGVDPEYRNAAYPEQQAPQEADDDEVAERAKASAEELSNLTVNRLGHTVGDHRAGTGTKVEDQKKAESKKGGTAADAKPSTPPPEPSTGENS